jgi:hypothetical protein
MTITEQFDYAHRCLNRLLQIEEEMAFLDKDRDSERIKQLRNEILEIQVKADHYLTLVS